MCKSVILILHCKMVFDSPTLQSNLKILDPSYVQNGPKQVHLSLTLLHSDGQKLHRDLAILSVKGLKILFYIRDGKYCNLPRLGFF